LGYVVAGLLGGLVGAAELASRYKDRPAALVQISSAWIYVILNVVASLAALLLVRSFGWAFGATGSAVGATQVLVASFAAIALFRSSLFILRVGDQDVGVGPSVVLSSLLGAADRDVDRQRAEDRSVDVGTIMQNVSFTKAQYALPTYCLALLQDLPLPDQASLRGAVDALAGTDQMTDRQKALALGLLLMNIAGPEVVRAAVKALGDELTG